MSYIARFIGLLIMTVLPLKTVADVLTTPEDIETALEKLKDKPDDRELLKTVAFYYMNIGEDSLVSIYADRLLDLGQRNNDRDYCELYGHIAKATAYLSKNDFSYFAHIEQARSISESTGNLDAMLSVYNSLAIHYLYNNSDCYTAASYYFRALECAKTLGDQRRTSIILSNLSGVYLMMNDISGLSIAEQAYELSHKLGDPIPMYYSACSLTSFYLMDNRPELAMKMVEEAERLHRKLELPGDSEYHELRARVAEAMGDTSEAYRQYRILTDIFKDKSIPFLEINSTYLSYARLLRRDHRAEEAIKVLHDGLDRSDSDSRLWVSLFFRELVYAYRDKGDYNKALDYSLLYQDRQDSLFNISRERTLQENRIRHDIESKERKIDEQKMELMSSRHRIVVLSIIAAAIALLLGVTYHNYRRKDRLYRAIVIQNREFAQREKMLMEQKTKPAMPEGKSDDIMSRFTQLMTVQKLYTDPEISVSGVAEKLDTNRTYLSRTVNECCGKSFTQVVNDYRIREAIALLSDLERNLPLKQVASMAGFSSLSTFYSLFQNFTGMTPARYRAQLSKV